MAAIGAMTRFAYPAASVGVAMLAFTYFLVTAPRYPFDIFDEGYMFYIAQQLLRDRTLYVDIELFNYLPGAFYIFVPLISMTTGDVFAIRAVLAIPLALCVWLVYRIVEAEVGNRAALIAAMLLIVAPGDGHRFYIAALNLALLLSAANYVRTAERRWLTILGTVTGIALCVRIDAGVAGFALLGVCAAVAPRLPAKATPLEAGLHGLFGLTIALAPIWAFFAAEGILSDYLRQLAAIPSAMLERSTADYQTRPPGPSEVRAGSTFAAVYYASLMVPVAAVAGLIGRRNAHHRRLFWLVTSVWLLFNLPQCLLERPDIAHFSHRTYAFIVPAVVYFCQSGALPRPPRGASSYLVAGLAWALLLIGGSAYAVLVHDSPGSLGQAFQAIHKVCLANGVCYPDAYSAITPHRDLMDEALGHLRPEEAIGVLPYGPGIAYLLRHPLPGRQSFLLPHSVRSRNGEREYLQTLDVSRVRYVLLETTFRYSDRETTTFRNYAPAVSSALANCFSPRSATGTWLLLERTSEEDAACLHRQ